MNKTQTIAEQQFTEDKINWDKYKKHFSFRSWLTGERGVYTDSVEYHITEGAD